MAEVALNKTGPSQARGPGGGHVPPTFWQISEPYLNHGGYIIPTQYYVPPPGFSDLATALP